MDVKDAVRDMKELLTLAARDVSVLNKVNQFLELGLGSFVVAKTERVFAEGTQKILTLYKIADPLHVLLMASRAGDFNAKIAE